MFVRYITKPTYDEHGMPLYEGWYFDGEDQGTMYGPYPTKEIADRAFIRYGDDLNKRDSQRIDNIDSTDYSNNSENRKRVQTLVKRRNHLAARTNSNPSLTYDIAERRALDWAIRVLEQILADSDGERTE